MNTKICSVTSANLALTLFLLAFCVAGCKPESEPAASPEASSSEAPADEASADETPADETPADETPADETPADETPADEAPAASDTSDAPADSDSSAADAPAASDESETISVSQVVLGDPTLTSGIPGEGDLTSEQIQAWVDDPANHATLEPELPLGLSAAQANIQGIEENPMTRAKIELGRQLYFDPRLSSNGKISCASCHHPDEGFGRKTQFGVGVDDQTGNRNSPISYNRIISGPQFWDGRAGSLEEQAAGPIANPIEMGNTHEKAIETVKGIEGYQTQFAKVFPGEEITMDNITKAIATFERALVTGPAPYDYFETVRAVEKSYGDEIEDLEEEDPELYAQYQEALEGSKSLSDSAKRGRDLFFSEKVGCTACHAGANFTDEKYHNLGVGMEVETPDLGRFEVTKNEQDKGAFKTPTVRNIIHSPPYMHDGSQATLEEVVEWYDKGGHPNPHLSKDVKKLNLTDQEKKDLVAFMVEGLTGEFPVVEQNRLPQ